MAGEELKQEAVQQNPQENEWDKLAEVDFGDVDQIREENEHPDESEPAGITRRTTNLPPFIEGVRREIVRRHTPNTMPSIEQLVKDASPQGLSYVEELCENWPLFKETEKVNVEGEEVDFPRFFPEIKYTGETDFVGYLSTPVDHEAKIKKIKTEIGKKNASIYTEACLDNPLVATIDFERYGSGNNADFACYHTLPDDLKKARIRLIDESIPLSPTLQLLNARLAGVQYDVTVKNEEEAECVDTVKRATIAYHEIGHAVDLLTNHLKIQEKSEVSSQEIEAAMTEHDKERALEIECSRKIPDMARGEGATILSRHELRVILERRGFDSNYSYEEYNYNDYNDRCYREMPCETVADNYARHSVCVKHRNHYFAENELDRQQNPEKRNLPIYGEMVYLGEAFRGSQNRFLDQELYHCGVVAGKRVAIREMVIPEGIKVNPDTGNIILPDDFDYHADQRRQNQQPILVEGTIRRNPNGGAFEVVDDDGEVCAYFAGTFRRQQNEAGRTDIINGDPESDDPCYRIEFDYSEESERAKRVYTQYGSIAYDKTLGINTEEEASILLINDNCMTRVLLPKGGFTSTEKLIDAGGIEYDMPTELFSYNGIPKVKLNGMLYEVVVGNTLDLAELKKTIAEAKNQV